jgi:hypothetical protein
MKLWLTLSAALLIPAAANAAEYGTSNRMQVEIAELNARIQKLESDLVRARNSRTGIQTVMNTTSTAKAKPAKSQPVKPRARLNPNLVRMQAIPKDDPIENAMAPAQVPVTLTLPEITVSALPALIGTFDVGPEEALTADADHTTAQADYDDFDPEASEDPLIRLDPETGRPIRPEATKAEPVAPKAECTDKAKCAKAPNDKQANATTKTSSRRSTRISWR